MRASGPMPLRAQAGVSIHAAGICSTFSAFHPVCEEARERAYAACDLIDFEGKTYRSDIGMRAVKR